MRSTCGGSSWLLDEKGELVGLSLGADATTEHQVGSSGIAHAFGYEYSPQAGVMARKIDRLPDSFGIEEVEHQGERCLLMSSNLQQARAYLKSELRFMLGAGREVQSTAAAWDSSNFAIVARGPDKAHLVQLARSFGALDIMAGGMLRELYPRQAGGLVYAIASKVPPELLAAVQAQLDETLARTDILRRSGVAERLVAAGRKWFSLSETQWKDESKTDIVVWLNPYDQHRYRSGWFTLSELEEWVTNTGPITSK